MEMEAVPGRLWQEPWSYLPLLILLLLCPHQLHSAATFTPPISGERKFSSFADAAQRPDSIFGFYVNSESCLRVTSTKFTSGHFQQPGESL
ncbi:hypothetical protein GYMLUDRAFT_40357 [Collybiopsis luxurians FD-317 M1]|uniref:Uncharacterized protein n=1 Tax=Collybiopsis luxurians FD-317 M1 TaxID=944289 RepID=A0A0D0CWC8_9AGAR|nr:hypothetical protein GYMLUDRAFT_40357 [Collybiopsis luxurians FD-317 M1]